MLESGGIKHLRAQGSYLYEHSSAQHLVLVEAKGDVEKIPYDRVVEAYGVQKCPELVKKLRDGDDFVKKRTLAALVELFQLPREVAICLKLGVLELIEDGILDSDADIQEQSAHVLQALCETSHGRMALLESKTIHRIVPVFTVAASPRTALHLYDALITFSNTFIGAQVLSRKGYLMIVIDHLKRELDEEMKLRAVRLLKNVINDGVDTTVYRAVELEAMELCSPSLYSANYHVRAAAADFMGAIGFIDKAKRIAVEKGIVKKLCTLLSDNHWQVTAASAGALMCLAVQDEAKRIVVSSGALQNVNQLLQSSKYLVQLNAVKLITTVAVFPPARKMLNVSSTENHLKTLISDKDALISKSATIALGIVKWEA